jgi:hypothetical protein
MLIETLFKASILVAQNNTIAYLIGFWASRHFILISLSIELHHLWNDL